MLAVERAELAQVEEAAQFGSRRDAGPALFVSQGVAILQPSPGWQGILAREGAHFGE